MISYNVERYATDEKAYREGVCLSTDTKPTSDTSLANGSKLFEMDTSIFYLYDEANHTWRAWT